MTNAEDAPNVSGSADTENKTVSEDKQTLVDDAEVIYRVEYLHRDGLKKFISSLPIDVRKKSNIGENTILEIVTPVIALEKKYDVVTSINESGDRSSKFDIEECDLADLKSLAIDYINWSTMVIHSPELVKAIRKIIPYYPGESLREGKTIKVIEPYKPLLFYTADIRSLHEETRQTNEKTHRALGTLLEVLEPCIEEFWEPIQGMLSEGIIDFESIWALFRPGEEVYFVEHDLGKHIDQPSAGIVIEAYYDYPIWTKSQGEQKNKADKNKREDDTNKLKDDPSMNVRRSAKNSIFANMYTLQDSWAADNKPIVTRLAHEKQIKHFDGRRDITSLSICPCKFWDKKKGLERRQKLLRQGKRKIEILRKEQPLMEYTGRPLNRRPIPYNHSLFYVDNRAADIHYDMERDTDFRNYWKAREYWSPTEPSDGDDPEAPEHGQITLDQDTKLTERQNILLTPWMPGLALKDKLWRIVHVDDLQDHPRSEEPLNRLVLDKEKKQIIRAACDSNDTSWNVDDIGNKGESKIILLHGAPGTGKTFTVEAFAEASGRPLIYLTVADIGLRDYEIEQKFAQWLDIAEMWGAFLLIDEADIFMERRSLSDLQRNALVAVFLRRIEYFHGVLFLTTNRPGHIDDAFLSRVSVAFEYRKLANEDRQEIWEGLFDKLSDDMKKRGERKTGDGATVEIDRAASKYVRYSQDVKSLEWNGREIRNALSTAISLARFRLAQEQKKEPTHVTVLEDDFKSVVSMSDKFKKFMDRIENMSEEERAAGRRDRPPIN